MQDLMHAPYYPPHIPAPMPPKKPLVILRTAGEEYRINEAGFIARACMGWQYSARWQALALVRYHNNGHVKESIPFARLRELKPHFDQTRVYGNGKPQWCLVDLDCGAVRHWGEPVTGLYFPD